jgi:hypothetical protein
MNDWLYKAKHVFTPGYSYESKVFQVIANHFEEGAGIDAIITEFFKSFVLLLRHRLLTKPATTGVVV